MGHARNYVSIDILRRIITDFFNYDCTFVQGLTDIDDKIILRTRQNYLFDKFIKNPPENWCEKCNQGVETLQKKFDTEEDADKKKMYSKLLAVCKETMAKEGLSQEEIINGAREGLVLVLDKELGHTVTDNDVFWDLPRYWEAKYWEDMDRLNVRRPTVQTRISEYVPEVIEMTEDIIKNGYAYESNGSVYFDVTAFNDHPNHFYAKLEPENMGNSELLADGEGKLTAVPTEKRSPNDFALWKKSKPGEPTWQSPWSPGRPGWHIECSAMSTGIFGKEFDIHTGGVDLKFPHHDNEIAQCEAAFDKDNWCNYFLHSGHLHIEGCKMSKSLKNFITIDQALEKHSARTLRLAFLMHNWYATLDYSDKTMKEAEGYEKTMNEFFLNFKNWSRQAKGQDELPKPSKEAQKLLETFESSKQNIYSYLADNFNTPATLLEMKSLVTAANTYVQNLSDIKSVNLMILEAIARYLTKLLKVFGVIGDNEHVDIGFELVNVSQSEDKDNATPIEYLEALAEFREQVRKSAIAKDFSGVLQACDDIRNDTLPELGVRLEDGTNVSIKVVGKKQALKEKEDRLKEIAAKEEKKRVAAEKARKLAEEKERKRRVDPLTMFKTGEYEGKFTKFDDKGIPTHQKDEKSEEGETPISKGQGKKFLKLWTNQEKLHSAWKLEQETKNVSI